MTDVNVNRAEKTATLDRALNVRGSEKMKQMIAQMREKITVH